MVVLKGMDLQSGQKIGERIRKSVAAQVVHYKAYTIKVSITIGMAQNKLDVPYDKIIQEADYLMYQGKQNGKNQVFVGF